jgi:hypothetical protein
VVLRPGPLCASADSEVVVLTVSSPSARPLARQPTAPCGRCPLPTATVRTQLPGLFSSEPLKGYHYTETLMPLTVLGHLLAIVKGTKKELWAVVVTAGRQLGLKPLALASRLTSASCWTARPPAACTGWTSTL